jgi:Tol biopolymer transport system component
MRLRLCSAVLVFAATSLAAQSARPWQSTDYYRLTGVSDPKVSPDGRRVAFVVTTVVEDKDRRHNEIWMAPADGSAPAFRYTSPSTEASSPNWSPDGTLLSFSSRRDGGEDDVWFLRTTPPGGEAFQIKGVRATPEFSRDGQWLLFAWRGEEPDSLKQQTWRQRVSPVAITRGADTKRFDGRVYTSIPIVADERGFLPPREIRRAAHLYVVPLAGGTPRQLTSGDLSQTSAAWSPDGKMIVFVQDSTENDEVRDQPKPQLFLLTVADGAIRALPTGQTENGDPAWSPDGRTIAFGCSNGRGQENDICVMPAAGGTARRLTTDWSLDPGAPEWSADGKTIYFSAETNGNVHLFAVAATGGPVRQVTSGERQLRGFSRSADGRTLAYTASDITHPTELFVAPLAARGGAEKRVTAFNDSLLRGVTMIPADTFWFAGVGGLTALAALAASPTFWALIGVGWVVGYWIL